MITKSLQLAQLQSLHWQKFVWVPRKLNNTAECQHFVLAWHQFLIFKLCSIIVNHKRVPVNCNSSHMLNWDKLSFRSLFVTDFVWINKTEKASVWQIFESCQIQRKGMSCSRMSAAAACRAGVPAKCLEWNRLTNSWWGPAVGPQLIAGERWLWSESSYSRNINDNNNNVG